MSARARESLDRLVDEGGEADDVLRSVVRLLAEEPGIAWAAIAFLEDGELVAGPQRGTPDEARRIRTDVVFQGSKVGELWVDGDAERGFLDRVALLVSPYVLIGWDTWGTTWEP